MIFSRLICAAIILSAATLHADDRLFRERIGPILESRCVHCHGGTNPKGGLSLVSAQPFQRGGDSGPAIVARRPDESLLLQYVAGDDPLMPKEGRPLSADDVEAIRDWIEGGADWPAGVELVDKQTYDLNWWSLRPLSVAEPPLAEETPVSWSAGAIDRFIFSRLRANNLQPNPRADRRTLIRRVTYDLTGLPPTPQEVDAFLRDDSPTAFEALVDRLLASPRYGEHWGRHWLDVTRFGESTGFEVNYVIDNAWPFRDYVIRSFNEDKPFDRFVMEHLAGDALGAGDPNVEVGLTFLVCGPLDTVGNADAAQAAQIRADTVDEIIRATSEAFLGLTVGCARCHDHKFDPVSQQDYYQLYATFAGVYHDDRLVGPHEQLRQRKQKLAILEKQREKLIDKKSALKKSSADSGPLEKVKGQLAELDRQIAALPSFPSLRVGRFDQPADAQHVFEGGDAGRKGKTVVPASISALSDVSTPYALPEGAPEQERRLALARWIVAKDNPLTPRVLVNRLWQYHFGIGIVATPSDFGSMGEKPMHPELLDWLANRLLVEGWRLKPLHKLIVMSEAYQQSSAYRQDAAQVDADARLLWRFPPRRLAAEEIRDTILYVAGRLDECGGGPGFRLYQYSRDNVATYTPLDRFGPETYRRSVYHQNARASRIDVLTDFDAPDCAFSVARRNTTTTPSQALALMNHSFMMDMAESFAERLVKDAGHEKVGQIKRAFELAFGRLPDLDEEAAAAVLIQQYGLRAFCRAVLNSSELVYVN